MKFSTKEDIDAPIDEVFAVVSEVERYERSALRRGAEVRRLSDPALHGVGMEWDVAFAMRGRERQVRLEMVGFEAPRHMSIAALSSGLASDFVVNLVPLSPQRTRVMVSLDLRPKNLSARLLVQSLKLAKASLTKQFKLRVADYAKEIETLYQQRS